MEEQPKQGRKLRQNTIEILVSVAILAGLAAILIPVFQQTRDLTMRSHILDQAKIIGDALSLYTQKTGGRLPSADRWCDALQPHIPKDSHLNIQAWQWNSDDIEPFGMVRTLSGVDIKTIKHPGQTVVFFEIAERYPNMSGDLSMQVPPHGNSRWNMVVMADGSRKFIRLPATETLPNR